MSRLSLISVLLLLIGAAGTASAGTWVFTGAAGCTNCGHEPCDDYEDGSLGYLILEDGETYNVTQSVTASFDNGGCSWCNSSCSGGGQGTYIKIETVFGGVGSTLCADAGSRSSSRTWETTLTGWKSLQPVIRCGHIGNYCCDCSGTGMVIVSNNTEDYTVSGITECIELTTLYLYSGGLYNYVNHTDESSYSFEIYEGLSYRLVFDGAYYDFTCDGDEVFDYDACIWVYGYTCGVDSIKLYKDNGGWVLDDSASQALGYDVYEMPIEDGEDYKISFIDSTIDGDVVVHNQTFSCIGDHVLIDFDRCNWIYPPNGPPIPIYLWTGYDYNIVVFKDAHGNLIENSQLAIYDQTDNQYIQRWTDAADGYTLLGARFDTDHDVRISLRTFDGVFTLDTTYPANGSAPVGEEDITTTNWTVPIKYNLNVLPVDQYGVALFDVFCGLSEYTPLDPQAFWGMDLSDQGYVAVTNCSGFAMCDIIAEKAGYVDYKVEALNWTSKSALVKDYRHNIVMEEE